MKTGLNNVLVPFRDKAIGAWIIKGKGKTMRHVDEANRPMVENWVPDSLKKQDYTFTGSSVTSLRDYYLKSDHSLPCVMVNRPSVVWRGVGSISPSSVCVAHSR